MPSAKTVLVVDDSRVSRLMARQFILARRCFWHVEEAASGEEAIARVASCMPDLILLDVNMPGMGGLAAAADALGRDFFALFHEQAGRRLETAVRQALRDNFPAVLSHSLHKAPLPLFAARAARDGGCRMRQAIAATPFEVGIAGNVAASEERRCLIQVNDVSASALREKLLRTHALALREQSISDGLTGIANRRHFDAAIDKELRRAP